MLFTPLDYTTVFLSYDEPNCEENYQHLLSLNPNALRVHGVKGSDKAHKEVAKLSKSQSVIIVDGDNFVKPSFYNTTIELPDTIDMNTSVYPYGYNFKDDGIYSGKTKVRDLNEFDKGFQQVAAIFKSQGMTWLSRNDPMHVSIYE
jgi:hypothetical protein